MPLYSSAHILWFRDTIDMIQHHSSLNHKEIETIIVEAIIKYLDKSIGLSMLQDIVREIQAVRDRALTPELALAITKLDSIAQQPQLEQEHHDKLYSILEDVLDLITQGR